jgi:ribosomal protein S18 acetylase RimI-like enzyme
LARLSFPNEEKLRMKIRHARLEDAMGIAHIIVDAFGKQEEWTYEGTARGWERRIRDVAEGAAPRTCIYVAVDEADEVLGFSLGCPSKAAGDPDEIGEVDFLYIRADRQRQGIGRALAQTVAADLERMGMTTIHILTPVDSTEARRFYERLGGRDVGRRDDYDDGEVIPLVIYEWSSQELIGPGSKHQGDVA